MGNGFCFDFRCRTRVGQQVLQCCCSKYLEMCVVLSGTPFLLFLIHTPFGVISLIPIHQQGRVLTGCAEFLSASFRRSRLAASPRPLPAAGPEAPPLPREGPRSRRRPSALFSSLPLWGTLSSAELAELLSLGGLLLLGDVVEGRASPSLELALSVLRLAQAFSLGGGAGTTLSGSASCLGGGAWLLGDGGSSSRPLNTSFSTERSLSLRREARPDMLPGCEDSLPVRERSS